MSGQAAQPHCHSQPLRQQDGLAGAGTMRCECDAAASFGIGGRRAVGSRRVFRACGCVSIARRSGVVVVAALPAECGISA